MHALAALHHHTKTLNDLTRLLDQLTEDSSARLIQSILLEVEDGVKVLNECVCKIRSSNVTDTLIEDLKTSILALEASLSGWRAQHPNTGPIQIDNRMYLFLLSPCYVST